LDVVRAAESLVSKSNSPVDMVVPPKSPGGTKDLKTTTIVMSKHTLAPQNPNNVSTTLFFFYEFFCTYIYIYIEYIFLNYNRFKSTYRICFLYMQYIKYYPKFIFFLSIDFLFNLYLLEKEFNTTPSSSIFCAFLIFLFV